MWHCLLKYGSLNEIARKHLQAVYWLHCATLWENIFNSLLLCVLCFYVFVISPGRAQPNTSNTLSRADPIRYDPSHSSGNNLFAFCIVEIVQIYCVMHSLLTIRQTLASCRAAELRAWQTLKSSTKRCPNCDDASELPLAAHQDLVSLSLTDPQSKTYMYLNVYVCVC